MCEDRDFTIRALKILAKGQITYIPEILYYYRIHRDSAMNFYRQTNSCEPDKEYLKRKHGKTEIDGMKDLAYRFPTKPYSFLREPLKARLRPWRYMLHKKILYDPFVKQIEFETEKA